MKAIKALDIVCREGLDNSMYGIITDWKDRIESASEQHCWQYDFLTGVIRDLFGVHCDIITRDALRAYNADAILYVYRDKDTNAHSFTKVEYPIVTVLDVVSYQWIDIYELV